MSSQSKTGHEIRWGRRGGNARDVFYTPTKLATLCLSEVPISAGDTLLDPCRGKGAFYDQMPGPKEWCEIGDGRDFYEYTTPVDWVVSNPPYSHLDEWLTHTARVAVKGFAYLLGWNNLTARRIELLEQAGFGISSLTMFKVFKWYGMSAFVVWERGSTGIIKYNRTVWREAAVRAFDKETE